MLKSLSFLICFVWLVSITGPAVAAPLPRHLPPSEGRSQARDSASPVAPQPDVWDLINQVQSATLYDYVAGLSGEHPVTIGGSPYTLATRSTQSAQSIEKATQYAYEHFQALGLSVSYHNWTFYSSLSRRNVVAEQPGSDPNCIYLVTAHLDSTSPTYSTLAPGADDNASGTAGVLVAADILSQHTFTCTLRYVLFTGEEQGLLGSRAYAEDMEARGDPIDGVLNLDMIGYNTPNTPPTIELDIRSSPAGIPDQVLSNTIVDVIESYELNLTPLVYPNSGGGSDHVSFWQAGYPAVLVIEDWDDHTPDYHKITDRVDTLNLPYFTDYVKAVVAAAAHLAVLTDDPPAPLPYQIYLALVSR